MDDSPQRLMLARADEMRLQLEQLSRARKQLFEGLESNRIMIQLVSEARDTWLHAAHKLES